LSSIGKDPDLSSEEHQKYQQLRLKYLMKEIIHIQNELGNVEDVYDMGSGDSFVRNRINNMTKSIFGASMKSSDINIDSERQPYGNKRFDVVFCLELIEHSLNPLFAMEEAHRILKDGGKLMLTTPNDYSLIYKAEHLLERKYEPHFHQFNERDLRWLLEEACFKINKLDKFKRSPKGWLARFSYNSFYVEATKA